MPDSTAAREASKTEPRAAKPSGFPEDLARLVRRLIPDRWLAAAFLAATAGVLVFLVLMMVAFARDPDEETAAALGSARNDLSEAKLAFQKEEARHSETKSAFQNALRGSEATVQALKESEQGLRESKATCARLEAELKEARADGNRLEEELADLRSEYKKLNEQARSSIGSIDGKVSTLLSATEALKKCRAEFAALRARYAALETRATEEDRANERARKAFDSTMEAVSGIDDGHQRLLTLYRLRKDFQAALAGTAYQQRLDKMIEDERSFRNKKEEAERQKRLRRAKATHESAMKKLRATKDRAKAVELLRSAAQELAGTQYETKVVQELEKREKVHRERAAKIAYEAALAAVKASPKAYEANLTALEEALEKAKGTRYAEKLKRMTVERRKTLKVNIARRAHKAAMARLDRAPDELDGNISALQEALAKAVGTEFEKPLRRRLEDTTRKLGERLGREAYEEALSQLRKSPKDHQANVAALEPLKLKAEGSSWVRRIEKLIAREGALAGKARE